MFFCLGKSGFNVDIFPLSISSAARLIKIGLVGTLLSIPCFGSSTPSATLSQANQAFSAGKPISSVEMTGTAQWIADSLKDTGSVKLTAKISGENIAEFNLSNGTRTEKQSAITMDRACTWSGKDGVEHNSASANCWTAMVWFLPHIALQNTGLPSALGLQQAAASSEKTAGVHLYHQLTITSLKTESSAIAQIQRWSETDLALDSSTLLPSSLKFNIHPDNNSGINLPVEVRYSNYKNVSGVELPMHIERYVNGSLELSIDIESAIVSN